MDEVGPPVEPDKANGSPDVAKPAESKVPPEAASIANNILASIRDWYAEEIPMYGSEIDPVLLSRIISTCFLQYSCVLAIDCGVSKDDYLKSSGIVFDATYAAAPKVG